MSDEKTNLSFKDIVTKVRESKFYTYSKKPLDFIEKGKIFKIIFYIIFIAIALYSLIYPFIPLFRVLSSGYFNFGVRYALAFIFAWVAAAVAYWLAFHLWRERRKKADVFSSSEFIVTPLISEIFRTTGEWLGLLLCLIGFAGGLFAFIFLGGRGSAMLSTLFIKDVPHFKLLNVLPGGLGELVIETPIVFGPVVGIIIVFATRFLSEGVKLLASIANNTKK